MTENTSDHASRSVIAPVWIQVTKLITAHHYTTNEEKVGSAAGDVEGIT